MQQSTISPKLAHAIISAAREVSNSDSPAAAFFQAAIREAEDSIARQSDSGKLPIEYGEELIKALRSRGFELPQNFSDPNPGPDFEVISTMNDGTPSINFGKLISIAKNYNVTDITRS